MSYECPCHEASLVVAADDDPDWPAGYSLAPASSPLPCACDLVERGTIESSSEVKESTPATTTCAETVGSSSNVLLLYQLQHFGTLAWLNLFLALLSLGYFAVIVVCLVINSSEDEFREEYKFTFHMLEFWGYAIFSVVNMLALLSSPKPMKSIYQSPLLLKMLVTTNVVMSAVPAILMTINRERFEYVSHNIEYANGMTMIFVDLVIFISLLKEKGKFMTEHIKFVVIFTLSVAVCAAQLLVWNLMQSEEGEQIAHYLEFSLDLFSAITTFWFCLDNKILADQWIKVILTQGMCPGDCLALTARKSQ